jgi:tetratricopeptide (TPR) repeat protein
MVLCLALLPAQLEAGKKKKKKKKKKKAAQVEETVAPSIAPPPPEVVKANRHLAAYDTGGAKAALEPLRNDRSPAVLVARARVLEQERNYDGAVTLLGEAASLDPADPAPLVYLGETYLHARQQTPADDAFVRAEGRAQDLVQAAPESTAALYLLAVAQQGQRKYEQALATLERARKTDPGNALIVYRMGATRAFQERWQPALDLLTEAINMDSGIAYAYYVRGLAASKLGRKDLMINDMDRFLAMAPSAPEASTAQMLRGSG